MVEPLPSSVLGAVLAGGQSRRFGSDKALAELAGETLLMRAVALVAQLCGEVVVVGRADAPAPTVPDRPAPGMGPLGGLAGALAHAVDSGKSAVLAVSVDALDVDPADLAALYPGPAFCESQPVIGVWPAGCLPVIEGILAGPQPHSLRRLAELTGARPVRFAQAPRNVNTPADLAELEHRDG